MWTNYFSANTHQCSGYLCNYLADVKISCPTSLDFSVIIKVLNKWRKMKWFAIKCLCHNFRWGAMETATFLLQFVQLSSIFIDYVMCVSDTNKKNKTHKMWKTYLFDWIEHIEALNFRWSYCCMREMEKFVIKFLGKFSIWWTPKYFRLFYGLEKWIKGYWIFSTKIRCNFVD